MGRSFAAVFACLALLSAALIVSVNAPPATATDQSRIPKQKPKGTNSPEAIKKCDDAESACKGGCDKNIIDIDNQVDICKRGCERERALCLPFRRAPGLGTTGVKPTTGQRPPVTTQP